MASKLLTVEEVAERLDVKLRTAYDLLAPGGSLHHLRIELGPKTIRVNPEDFEAFIRTRQHAAS